MSNWLQFTVTDYARWVIRWRWPVLFATLAICVLAGLGATRLEFTSDFRVFFGPHNPERVALEELENTYTKTDNLLFVIKPSDGTVFSLDNLALIQDLAERAWQLPHAIRVDSVTNFQHTRAIRDEVIVEALVPDAQSLTADELARVRTVGLSEPTLFKRLVSEDGETAGINVTLQFPGNDHTYHLPESVESAYALLDQLKLKHPDVQAGLTGLAVMSYAEIEVSKDDLSRLAPLMYGVLIILMVLLLRSFTGALSTLLIAGLSVAVAFGVAGWLGMRISVAAAITPVIIMTLAVADSVHILVSLFEEMRDGKSQRDALIEAFRINAQPVFLTSLTTGIGFLSLNFSDAPPFHDMGNLAALGVFVAWGLSVTLLLALLSVLPCRPKPRDPSHETAMQWLVNFIVEKRRYLFAGTTLIALLCLSALPALEIGDRYKDWFGEELQFRQDTDFAEANLIGPYTIEFSIPSVGGQSVSDPRYLSYLESFMEWLRRKKEVTQVVGLTDVMKRINQAMHGDDPAHYRIPERSDLAAQYLLLYEMSLPYGLDLNSQMSIGKDASRVVVHLKDIPSQRMKALAGEAEQWLEASSGGEVAAPATGVTMMFVYVAARNIQSMMVGTVVAFLLIAVVITLVLRSFKLGLLSLVSNFLPILMTFGVWSLLVGQVGIIASVITATSLGLIVDDTVHIMSKYSRAKREHSFSTHDGIRFTFARVGRALWVTTFILVLGFLTLTGSTFQVSQHLGLMTSAALVFAILVDFFMLPPLLMLIDRQPDCDCVSCSRRAGLIRQ